jgi:5,5'-dehydrodivanillate O-demethylase oxygenase subunit
MSDQRWEDLYHTGPGTLAGAYLRMFWQPVYRGKDLAIGQAVPIRIMSEDFTLYRGSTGTPHVVSPRCAHRGTQLSLGWVEGDCIRCFYHGWKYEASGQCVEQPGEEESFATKIRIRTYPTQEYLGLIFAYLGDGQAPALPRYSDLEEEGIIDPVPRQDWPCNYFNRLDNAGDPVHVPFVHRESRRRMGIPESVPSKFTAEESECGIKLSKISPKGVLEVRHFVMPNINHLPGRVRTGGGAALPDREGWMNPSLQRVSEEDKGGVRVDRLLWRVPIDDEHCASIGTNFIPLTGDAAKEYEENQASRQPAKGSNDLSDVELGESVLAGKLRIQDLKLSQHYKLISVEDYAAQVGQGRIVDHTNYHLGRNDVAVILLRRLWERELKALAEGRTLKEWKLPRTFRIEPTTNLESTVTST